MLIEKRHHVHSMPSLEALLETSADAIPLSDAKQSPISNVAAHTHPPQNVAPSFALVSDEVIPIQYNSSP